MKRKQTGFTLVELLVVIAIIGILMGLAIPAVNAAREAARRTECGVNMKNLALAAVLHENSKKRLPGWIEDFGTFSGTSDPSDPDNTELTAHRKIGTWAVAMLPYLEAQPTYEHWSQDRYPVISNNDETFGSSGEGFHPLAAPNLAIFQCPSNPVSAGDAGKNSYIANNGGVPIDQSGANPSGIVTFAMSQSKANGAMNAKYIGTGVSIPAINPASLGPYTIGAKVQLDDFKDGQGNTVLFSENVQALPWHRAGLIDGITPNSGGSAIDLIPDNGSEIAFPPSSRYVHGLVWHYEDPGYSDSTMTNPTNRWSNGQPLPPNDYHQINGGGTGTGEDIFNLTIDNLPTGVTVADLARPSSAHTDGVNIGMADGSTRFINTSVIDPRVYQAMLTPRGKSSDVPWPEFVLTDEIE